MYLHIPVRIPAVQLYGWAHPHFIRYLYGVYEHRFVRLNKIVWYNPFCFVARVNEDFFSISVEKKKSTSSTVFGNRVIHGIYSIEQCSWAAVREQYNISKSVILVLVKTKELIERPPASYLAT